MARCIDCRWCYLDAPMSRWKCEKGHIPVVYGDDEHCSTDENECIDFIDLSNEHCSTDEGGNAI